MEQGSGAHGYEGLGKALLAAACDVQGMHQFPNFRAVFRDVGGYIGVVCMHGDLGVFRELTPLLHGNNSLQAHGQQDSAWSVFILMSNAALN